MDSETNGVIMTYDPKKVDFVFKWLALADKWNKQDDFWWRCDEEYAPVTIFINCNDLFYWATADCEEINSENIDSYDQCMKDADAVKEFGHCYANALWCARQRGMRPQGACYKHYPKELWPLFDACGLERETDNGPFGNPKPQPKL